MSAVFYKAYIHTFTLFPKNKLKLNSDIALAVNCRFFGSFQPENNVEIKEPEIQRLYEELKDITWIQEKISNYYLLNAFYYSYGSTTDLFKENVEDALKKSRHWVANTNPISYKDVQPFNKNIKQDIRLLKKEIRKLNSEKIEKEKLNIIKPISVTSSHVMFVVSLFSTLFLLSGFIYNKILFSHFNVSVSDFFSISDYLASSVDVISAAAIATILGMASFFWGLSSALSDELQAAQLEIENKSDVYLLPFIIITSSLGLVLYSYRTGELLNFFLYPLIFLIFLYVLFRMPFWKYIENREAVSAALISILYFSIHLGFSIKDKVNDVRSENYSSPYSIEYANDYKENKNDKFIASNSNYVFLWDEIKNKVYVIPKTKIVKYYAN